MEWNNDKGNMQLFQHWLDTGQLPCEESEDDLSIHYTNYFKFHKEKYLLRNAEISELHSV